MTCHDVRRIADAFLSRQTTAETNHDLLRHLDGCPACRADLEGRRRLRARLRGAFKDAPELAPSPDFSARLRTHLQGEAEHTRVRAVSRRAWLGLAAALVLAVGMTGGFLLHRWDPESDALAKDAIGDHENCALKYRKVRTPTPLPEAAAEFDQALRLLIDAPPDEIPTPGGPVRVVDRHACAYESRRFGHLVMEYRGHVVSLLMTAGGSSPAAAGANPRAIGRAADGLSVVSLSAPDHTFLLVGDLGRMELTQLSTIIAKPLAQRLTGAVLPHRDLILALQRTPAERVCDRHLAVSR